MKLLLLAVCSCLILSCGGLDYDTQDDSATLQDVIDTANNMLHIHDTLHARQAINYVTQAYNDAPGKTTKDLFNYYKFKFDVIIRDLQNPNLALRTADSLLLLLEDKKQFQKEYVLSLYYKGDGLFAIGDYNDAYEKYFLAKNAGERFVTECELGDFSYRVGMVLFRQERFAEAARYFRQSFVQLGSCSVNFALLCRRQEVLDNAGISYDKAGMPDSALYFFNYTLSFIDSVKGAIETIPPERWNIARAVVYGNMAGLHLQAGKYDMADSLLDKSIAINILPGNDNRDAQFSYLKKSRLHLLKAEEEKAYAALSMTRSLLDSLPNKNAQLEYYKLMSVYFEQVGQTDSALHYLKNFLDQRELYDRENKELLKTDLIENVTRLEDKHQLNVLRNLNQVKKNYLFIAAILIVLAITIALFIYYNSKRSKRYIRSLELLNGKIKDQRTDLKLAVSKLEANSREKDRILRMVAHDLRTPIAGISALTDILLMEDNLNPEQIENLQLIKVACENSLTLSYEIMEACEQFAPAQYGKKKTNLKELLQAQVEMLRLRAKEKNQKIQLEIPETELIVEANEEKISRAVNNIIINAIKFSNSESTVHVAAKKLDTGAQIEIRDSGIGIPQKLRDKVFNMFSEAKRYGTAGEKPFGLGLSIAKHIIEDHKGNLWLESLEGLGTTFYIFIPYTQDNILEEHEINRVLAALKKNTGNGT